MHARTRTHVLRLHTHTHKQTRARVLDYTRACVRLDDGSSRGLRSCMSHIARDRIHRWDKCERDSTSATTESAAMPCSIAALAFLTIAV